MLVWHVDNTFLTLQIANWARLAEKVSQTQMVVTYSKVFLDEVQSHVRDVSILQRQTVQRLFVRS